MSRVCASSSKYAANASCKTSAGPRPLCAARSLSLFSTSGVKWTSMDFNVGKRLVCGKLREVGRAEWGLFRINCTNRRLAGQGTRLAGDQIHQRLFSRGQKTVKVVHHHRRLITKGKKVRVKKFTRFMLTMLFLNFAEVVGWGALA